ncbi:MAG: phosphatidylserine decarboxylase [Nakamurella sp.]
MADDTHGRAVHILSLVRDAIPPIHRGGLPIIGAALGGTLLGRKAFRAVGLNTVSGVWTRFGLVATGASALFFRAPVRVTPATPGLVVAPADGLVSLIEEAAPPAELGLGSEPRLRVSIFLSVLDVHVQRIPMSGLIRAVAYRPGKFLSADLDKASEDNERNSLLIQDSTLGIEVVVTQIAGLIARRIVCDVVEGASATAGDTYGLIRFGSRLDTYLPVGTALQVSVGQRTIGGETVLADLIAGV